MSQTYFLIKVWTKKVCFIICKGVLCLLSRLLFNNDDFFIFSFGLQATDQFAALTLHETKDLKPVKHDEKHQKWIKGSGCKWNCTCFIRPVVKRGLRTLRMRLQSSSSAMLTASYKSPFRRKFWNKQKPAGMRSEKPSDRFVLTETFTL